MIETLKFKDGFWMGILGWIMSILLVVVIGILIMLPFLIRGDHKEMVKQRCVMSKETRTYTEHYTTLVGKVIIPQTRTVTENLYTCDDKNRWR